MSGDLKLLNVPGHSYIRISILLNDSDSIDERITILNRSEHRSANTIDQTDHIDELLSSKRVIRGPQLSIRSRIPPVGWHESSEFMLKRTRSNVLSSVSSRVIDRSRRRILLEVY